MNFRQPHNDIEKKPSYLLRHIRFKPLELNEERLYGKVKGRISQEKPMKKSVSVFWKYSSVAAMIAFLFLSVYTLVYKKTAEQQATYVEVSSVSGSKTRIFLPDSTVVWLKDASTIRYPLSFAENERRVEFIGSALFDVREENNKPFIVSMSGMQVNVLGTVFNIWTEPGSEIVETTLLEGLVELYSGKNEQALCQLQPNQQALYDGRSGKLSVYEIDASSYSTWVTGNFIFAETSLNDIAWQLERAFNIKIHIKKERLRNKRFNARFVHQETLDEILSVLQIPGRYNYRKEKGEIYIY